MFELKKHVINWYFLLFGIMAFFTPKVTLSDAPLSTENHNSLKLPPFNSGHFSLVSETNGCHYTNVDFGIVNIKAKNSKIDLYLTNYGDRPATIEHTYLVGDNSQFYIKEPLKNIVVHPNEIRRIIIVFSPKSIGNFKASLKIKSN